jgi:hypothetical protein
MSKLTVEDFKNLNVAPFAEKVAEVTDLEFLTELEKQEKEGKNRVGVIDAINTRQGELYEKQADVPAPPKEYETEEEVLEKEDEVEGLGTKEEDVAEADASANASIEVEAKAEGEDKADLEGEDAIEKIKQIRLELDRIVQFSEGHFRVRAETHELVLKSKSWLGKLLHFEGAKSPYNVDVKTARDIPAIAERNEGREFDIARRAFGQKDVLPAILELREDLDKVAEEVASIQVTNGQASICVSQAWAYLIEAKFSLGMQLSELRIK